MSLGQSNSDPYGLEAAYREATEVPHHAKKNAAKRPAYKRVWFWLLIVALVLTVGVRIALNPLAVHFTQKGLGSIPKHQGSFESVKVSVIPLTYTITKLKITQDADDTAEPMVFAESIRA